MRSPRKLTTTRSSATTWSLTGRCCSEKVAHYYESKLRKADGSTNKGSFGRAVRLLIRDSEYSLILAAGFESKAGDPEVTSDPSGRSV